MSAEAAMVKARANLLVDQPFFGTLALRLKLVVKDDVQTAATDGTHLFYAPKFVEKQSPQQLRGLIAHEVMHCVLSHTTRRGERQPKKWNVAADLAINIHLQDVGFVLPEGGLIDVAYKDKTAEAIYDELPDDEHEQCAWGMVLDSGAGSIEKGSSQALESEWQVAIAQAAEIAEQRGKLPGGLKYLIKDVVSPKVPWRSVLWPFMTAVSSNDYSWRKPNRAYISEDEYLPSMYNEAAGEIAIVIDTSGSINSKMFAEFASEIRAVHGDVRPERLHVVQCDSRVQHVVDYLPDDIVDLQTLTLHGGGGTAFDPAFAYISEHLPNVEAIVYLTDMESSAFGPRPAAPVLWVSTSHIDTAPFGTVIRM